MKGGTNYVMVLVGGADSDTTFHSDTWNGSAGSWTVLPPFPGGPRRGGVGGGIDAPNFWSNTFFFGLGLDQGLARHKDWWRLDFPVGINEEALDRIGLYPNPANSTVTVSWPDSWTTAWVEASDGMGRTVSREQVNKGMPVSVGHVSAGGYLVVVEHGSTRLHGILTILH